MRRMITSALLFAVQYVIAVRWLKPARLRSLASIYYTIDAISAALDRAVRR